MRALSPALRLLRGLMAVALLLGLWANAASAAPAAIEPAWLAAAICHADSGSDAPSPDKAIPHEHCAWCQAAAALILPPPTAVAAPSALIGVVASPSFAPADPAARPVASHAPRGPPAVV
jgi:hypothetical protein